MGFKRVPPRVIGKGRKPKAFVPKGGIEFRKNSPGRVVVQKTLKKEFWERARRRFWAEGASGGRPGPKNPGEATSGAAIRGVEKPQRDGWGRRFQRSAIIFGSGCGRKKSGTRGSAFRNLDFKTKGAGAFPEAKFQKNGGIKVGRDFLAPTNSAQRFSNANWAGTVGGRVGGWSFAHVGLGNHGGS